MSTMHIDASLSIREDMKPQMILDFNSTKGGLDNLTAHIQLPVHYFVDKTLKISEELNEKKKRDMEKLQLNRS